MLFNNVYARLAAYVTSLLVGLIPAWAAGWFLIDTADGWINMHLQIEGFVTAVGAATGITGGIFKRFGVK